MSSAPIPQSEPLAIIGLACKYANGIDSPEALYEQVMAARCMHGAMPSNRMDASFYYHPTSEATGTSYSKGGYFLNCDLNAFDSPFFQLSEIDVMAMDPQQKMLLENVYHALENAGIPLKNAISSPTSVFVGCSNNDHLALANSDLLLSLKGKGTGTSPSILANRVSWFYDFQGTSQTIDTACSSSLVAFHQGCMDVRAGKSAMSIISGINLIEHPGPTLYLSSLGVLSPDGKSMSFDARANGYGRGEGVGTVIVKPLQAALRDGNRIRAIVRSTGSNQDGRTPGITVPNPSAQERLIHDVYRVADLDPRRTGYVEAHGTGTQVGDPLEVQAILAALGVARDSPLYVGSVKSVLGHLEGGAGLAGLISATLAVESKMIPPVAGLQSLNPKIPQRDDLKFAREATPWPRWDVRRASINSFGFGGTNAHAVVEDVEGFFADLFGQYIPGALPAPEVDTSLETTPMLSKPLMSGNASNQSVQSWSTSRLFVISAFDEAGIQRNTSALAEYLDSKSTTADTDGEDRLLNNLCHTLNEKRTRFDWRSYHVADSIASLRESLQHSRAIRQSSAPKPIRFVFTGQGANWAGMACDMLKYPLFRRRIQEAAAYLRELGSGWDLFERMTSKAGELDEPTFAQSSCVAVQVALVDLLASWKVVPETVVGHSSGEIAAAYCAGHISRQAAWKVAFCRGKVCARRTDGQGRMLAAAMPVHQLERVVARVNKGQPTSVKIGCYNSPRNLTLTGRYDDILRLKLELDDVGALNRMLPVKVAYHSDYMQDAAPEYLSLLGEILDGGDTIHKDASIQMISSVTGQPVPAGDVQQASYWVKNLVSPVRFCTALLASMEFPGTTGKREDTLIEIGPHSTLRSAIKESFAEVPEYQSVQYGSLLKRYETNGSTILHTLGMMFCSGHEISLAAINDRRVGTRKIPMLLTGLPGYAFDHSRSVRGTSRRIEQVKFPTYNRHELLGVPVEDSNPYEQRWRNVLRPDDLPWLRMNRMKGQIHFPGVAYILMATEALQQRVARTMTIPRVRIANMSILAPLQVPDSPSGVEIQVSIYPTNVRANGATDWATFRIISYDTAEKTWVEHCVGSVRAETGPPDLCVNTALRKQCAEPVDIAQMYHGFTAAGMDFGENLRNIQAMKVSPDRTACTATITAPSIAPQAHDQYPLHPCSFESILHALLYLCEASQSPMVTNYIEEVVIVNPNDTGAREFESFARRQRTSATTWTCDVSITTNVGDQDIQIKGLDLVQLPANNDDAVDAESFYTVNWRPDVKLLASADALHNSAPVDAAQHLPTFDEHEGYQLASAIFLQEAKEYVTRTGLPPLPTHHQAFMDWMEEEYQSINNGTTPLLDKSLLDGIRADPDRRKSLLDRVARQSARGELLVRVGTRMIDILEQKIDCLEVMFGPDNLMERTYEEGLPGQIAPAVAGYLHCLAHAQTGIKILEVGAGTGSATKVMLDSLRPTEAQDGGGLVSSVSSYDFTDISAAFFEKARARFHDWADILRPKLLNIEQDPAAQGFELGSYDLVIATHVLHATADLNVSLKNIRALLKEGGDLIVIENIQPKFMCSQLPFGLLPGWWRSVEPYRKTNPLILKEHWTEELQNAGLRPRLIINDTDDGINEMSAFVASPMPKVLDGSQPCSIIYSSTYPGQQQLALEVADRLPRSCTAAVVDLADISLDHSDTVGIVLVGCQGLDLSELTSSEYDRVKFILTSFQKLLWVTCDPTDVPKSALATGLVRSTRWEREHDNVNIILLSVSLSRPTPLTISSEIVRLCENAFISCKRVPPNSEYRIEGSNGVLLTNRLFPAAGINECIGLGSRPRSRQVPLGTVDHPIKLTSIGSQQPNGFHFIEDPQAHEPLDPDEVKIRIHAAGLDEEDADQLSRLIPGHGFGDQGSGTVVEIGHGVQGIQVGDQVMALRTGPSCALQTFFRTHSATVAKIPDGIRLSDAAALPLPWVTAYHSLVTVARLDSQEKVLIHPAIGATGQAAVQVASMLGATVYATVETDAQRQTLAEYGVEESHILDSASVEKQFGTQTSTQGVDVLLNLRRDGLEFLHLSCLSPFGRLVDISGSRAFPSQVNSPSNQSYYRVNMRELSQLKPESIRQTLRTVAQLLASPTIRPVAPFRVGYSQLQRVLSEIRRGSRGPWVIQPLPNDPIPPLGSHQFDPSASYLLIGGFGGLGRSVARWMHHRGAKHFIFFSRSGASSAAARELCADLRAAGCAVSDMICDTTDAQAVAKAMAQCEASMPPIRGCLQASMVLEDSMLSNMDHTRFLGAITPKVQGTINVASALAPIKSNLDFFVMLSSSAGIVGNRGQANYAAANTFLDAFAGQLVTQGYPATSVSLGSVLSVGWVAENQHKLRIAFAFGALSEDLLLSILEYHMDPAWGAAQSIQTCHTVVGVRSARDFQRQSIPLPGFMAHPLFSPLLAIAGRSQTAEQAAEAPVSQGLREASSMEAAVEVVTRAIVHKLARIMALSVQEIDPQRSLGSYGVDSLVTVDLKAWFQREVGVSIGSGELLGEMAMTQLAQQAADASQFLPAELRGKLRKNTDIHV
uniref:Highly reducing polyketide synthase otaA n=1 Tax=Aspergillus niger (strain ATCC MYA-4892 / CBS 513.88 / FGSC A1513) TaxID=425011 RepID=OTAA_ASPNC|nr:RecName: Full=Highly reducing polyketide synthase otaA; AltName: Full=Ochratoxin biosynthesis cluster protein 1; AltName: Full=Ochratoxin biosynthesis cluster protein A [Aspergillus niger CBS 513.88]